MIKQFNKLSYNFKKNSYSVFYFKGLALWKQFAFIFSIFWKKI